MYLETILHLSNTKKNVRAIDIAEHMKYSKPSVSRALGLLREKNLITVTDGFVVLTKEGETKAKVVFERHSVLTEFFVSIGATREVAEENACRIEHVISDELFELIKCKQTNLSPNK